METSNLACLAGGRRRALLQGVFWARVTTTTCKTADPPRRFQGKGRRIETMWSEEHQSWCQWDAESQDYVVDQELNRVAQPASNTPKDQGEEMNRAPD